MFFEGISSGTGTVTVGATDGIILADATAGVVTVDLPAAEQSTGRTLTVKKIDATANGVVLDGSGSETIDGAATQTITAQYMALTVACDGTEWWIV